MLCKYTLKALRELVRQGAAEDYTHAAEADAMELWQHDERVGYSKGKNGINGALVRHNETGRLYVILVRCSNLYILF